MAFYVKAINQYIVEENLDHWFMVDCKVAGALVVQKTSHGAHTVPHESSMRFYVCHHLRSLEFDETLDNRSNLE